MLRNVSVASTEGIDNLSYKHGPCSEDKRCRTFHSTAGQDVSSGERIFERASDDDRIFGVSSERPDGTQVGVELELMHLARAFYRAFCLQQTYFPFANARDGWFHILLDSFINAAEQKDVSITSACLSSGMPQTTALRHIQRLVDRGLLRRKNALHDQRVAYLELTRSGYLAVVNYLIACQEDRCIRGLTALAAR